MRITKDIRYVGVNDHSIKLFEAQYAVPHGMSYNSYIILDEKIAIMDSVDVGFGHEWLDAIAEALCGRLPDYLVVLHMEPDHSANITAFIRAYPATKLVASAKAFSMMQAFFGTDFTDRAVVVSEGDTLPLGKHTLRFFTAPMVHWPEVLVAYDEIDRVLFSADAFGKFGALDTSEDWACEARRYYFGIVGKYGAQVRALLDKVRGLDIAKICPLHGPVLSEEIDTCLTLYRTWAEYRPENEGVVIAYTSVYGNTGRAISELSDMLLEENCPHVVKYDLTKCDMAEAVEDAFRYDKLVLASTTYNGGIFPPMREFIHHLTERNYQKRTVGLIENGSWAPSAIKVMQKMLETSPEITFTEARVSIRSALNEKSRAELSALAKELTRGYAKREQQRIDPTALFQLGYGLYVITSNDGERDNGLIANAVTQVTNTPNRVAVSLSKETLSHHMIKKSGRMNINCLSEKTPLEVFRHFGYQSGRAVDKFKEIVPERSANGLAILPKYANAYMSLATEKYVDLDTHGMFICSITEAKNLSGEETMTYTYYQKYVKAMPNETVKNGYVCKICGYVYDGKTLPQNFICPICKHGREDFEKISNTKKEIKQ